MITPKTAREIIILYMALEKRDKITSSLQLLETMEFEDLLQMLKAYVVTTKLEPSESVDIILSLCGSEIINSFCRSVITFAVLMLKCLNANDEEMKTVYLKEVESRILELPPLPHVLVNSYKDSLRFIHVGTLLYT